MKIPFNGRSCGLETINRYLASFELEPQVVPDSYICAEFEFPQQVGEDSYLKEFGFATSGEKRLP